MERTTLTLKEILEQEDCLVYDSSITSDSFGDWYWEGIYPESSFSGIDIEIEKSQMVGLKRFLELIRRENVYSVPGVVLEIKKVRDMVSDKIRFLKKHEKAVSRRFRKKIPQNGFREGVKRRKLLEDIHDLFYEAYRETKRAVFYPKQKELYDFLRKLVLNVTERTDAKVDNNVYYRQSVKPKDKEDFHTDEDIVASAFYSSLVDRKKVGILTRDSDIRRILINTVSYMANPEARELNMFPERLQENGVRVYYMTEPQTFLLDAETYDTYICIKRARVSDKAVEDISNRVLSGKNPFIQTRA